MVYKSVSYRKFGKYLFHAILLTDRESLARKTAFHWRGKNYYARITKSIDPHSRFGSIVYEVYVRKIEKK